jgi:membrane carboxypeptidase/penicillin-binding protein
VARASTAWIVRDLLVDAVRGGTGRAARIEGVEVAGKTGTSSGLRDAWFAGQAGSVVAVAWTGRDDGGRLGLTGAAGAAPLWRAFMRGAVAARPRLHVERPFGVVLRRVDPGTGLLVSRLSSSGREEPFRRGALPKRKRLLVRDRPAAAVR